MSTRAHIAIKTREGKFLHMYHHCDGYPDGVGCELSDILSDYKGDWDGEDVRKFINNAEDDYQITENGVVWDQEYVYIIDCQRKTLSCYYKGITSMSDIGFDLECPGDELLIHGNKFSTDKKSMSEDYENVFQEAISRWGIVNQVFMVMEECGELLNVLAKAKRERSTPEEIITELADVSIMCDQMAYHFGKEAFLNEKKRKLERLKKRVFGEI